jgi:Ser/Thr protein kinase RdoA (MazF antagonist)
MPSASDALLSSQRTGSISRKLNDLSEPETPLAGGDTHVGESVVVRVADTVRRPVGAHTPAVHALLRHFEAVGFDGAPRVLGIDGKGREILTFIEGTAAVAPVPTADELVAEVGRFLRAMHDAQADFRPDQHAPWQRMVGAPSAGEVICHNDLFWPNLIFDNNRLAGLIDWDLAAPAPRLHDVASAATYWVALRPDDQCEAWGVPTENRADRLRALCNGYGLGRAQRSQLLEAVSEKSAIGLSTYHAWGRDERRPGWAETWNRDQDRFLVARDEWFRKHRREVSTWLR